MAYFAKGEPVAGDAENIFEDASARVALKVSYDFSKSLFGLPLLPVFLMSSSEGGRVSDRLDTS